jgi:hypothetical protein
MESFVKVYGSMLDSTIWDMSKETRLMWVTFMLKKDMNGYVRGTEGSMAAASRLTIEEARKSISELEAPDPQSKTKDCEGSRIVRVDGGWNVVTHFKYRDDFGQEAMREYWRRKKEEAKKKKDEREVRRQKKGNKSKGPLPGEAAFEKAVENGEENQANNIADNSYQRSGS